jgi:hypothetical protein
LNWRIVGATRERRECLIVVPRRTATLLALLVTIAMTVTSGAVPGTSALAFDASERVIRHRYRLAEGVTLTTIRYPRAPNEVRVVTLTQGHRAVADVIPAGPRYPAYRLPSAMAWGADALSAVNDDFSVHGRPKHVSMIDGELWTSGLQLGVSFAFSSDGTRAYAGVPKLTITGAPRGDDAFQVDRWNAGAPRRGQIGAFTPRGGSEEQPPGNDQPTSSSPRSCAARLVRSGPISWLGPNKARLGRSYRVDAQPQPCPKTPIAMGSAAGTVVLAAHAASPGGASIHSLEHGQSIRLGWTFRGWPRAVDVIGGTPQVVDGGHNVGPPYHPGDPYIFNRNPRTAVGVNKGCQDSTKDTRCKVFIVTVDGRQSGWSRGMRFPDLGRLMIRLGAYDAINLDGGGSTETWIRRRRSVYCERPAGVGGCFANRPSDPAERPAVMALVVLPRTDPGDPPR